MHVCVCVCVCVCAMWKQHKREGKRFVIIYSKEKYAKKSCQFIGKCYYYYRKKTHTLHHPPSLPPQATPPYPHLSHTLTHTHIHSCLKIIIIIINGSSYTNSRHTLHNPIRLHWKVFVILSNISFHIGYVEHHTEGASTKWHIIHCTLDPFHTDTQNDSLIMQLWSNPWGCHGNLPPSR